MNRGSLLSDLARDEGYRPNLYDDANGKNLVKGSTIIGHPTIGHGWCPETAACPPDLAEYILGYFADQTWADLTKAAPWITTMPEPCQRALCNMAYQLGVSGLLKFNVFMSLMREGKYKEASDDLTTTLWFRQSGQRAPRIQALIEQGIING